MRTNLDAVLERVKERGAAVCILCKYSAMNSGGGTCHNKVSECPTIESQIEWLMQEVKEPIKLTVDEKVILKNIFGEYKYIARNKDGNLSVHTDKPKKDDDTWFAIYMECYFNLFDHLFQFIKWEDDEPYYIPDLLKYEVIHE